MDRGLGIIGQTTDSSVVQRRRRGPGGRLVESAGEQAVGAGNLDAETEPIEDFVGRRGRRRKHRQAEPVIRGLDRFERRHLYTRGEHERVGTVGVETPGVAEVG